MNPSDGQENHSLLIRTLETVASLNTKIDVLLGEVSQIRTWREDVNTRQHHHEMQMADHSRAIGELRTDVNELQARPRARLERWHYYVGALLCGSAGTVAALILTHVRIG